MNLVLRYLLLLLASPLCRLSIVANPSSKPYIPFRTNPFDTASGQHHELAWDNTLITRSAVRYFRPEAEESAQKECPFRFSLGVSSSSGSSSMSVGGGEDPIVSASAKAFGIIQPPVIYPIHPSQGPGRQVLYTTQYEHLDLLSPITVSRTGGSSTGTGSIKEDTVIKEGLAELPDFPLLFESSSFLTSPIVHDVDGDGIPDAILADYDGGIYIIGLYAKPGTQKYFHRAQVPRLFVRRNWVEERLKEASPKLSHADKNETHDETPRDPYHSYFEYNYMDGSKARGDVLQGVTANVLGQDSGDLKGLTERRSRLVKHEKNVDSQNDNESKEQEAQFSDHANQHHRRLQSAEQSDKVDAKPQGKEGDNQSARALSIENKALQVAADRPVLEGGAAKLEHIADTPKVVTEAVSDRHDVVTEVKRQEMEIGASTKGLESKEGIQHDQLEAPKQEMRDGPKQGQNQIPNQEQPKTDKGESSDGRSDSVHSGAAKQDANVDAQAPQEVQKPAHDPEKLKQVSDTDVQRQAHQVGVQMRAPGSPEDVHLRAEMEAAERREALGVDASKLPSDSNSQEQVHTNVKHGDGSKDEKVDDKAWNQIRGGEGGGSWDDPGAVHDDKPPAMKSKDLGDDYQRYPKDDEVRAYGGYDDYYGERMGRVRERETYYDDKHYVRVPPHILANPVIAEVPQPYDSNNGVEELLIVPVSYFMDEDEYDGLFSYKRFEHTDHGDETEVRRGMYVASAIMLYSLGQSPRWGRQEHLDLSTDFTAPENATLMQGYPLLEDRTKMGAFALSSPTVADIDGDAVPEVLIGTSMGIVYGLDSRHLYNKEGWPVQMQRSVESRILVEDVLGDTNLEVFVADVGGNVVCLDHKANKIWHRNLPKSVGFDGTDVISFSPMTLGDVDGDGKLDLVIALGIKDASQTETVFVFALTASTGADVPNFPIAFKSKKSAENDQIDDSVHKKIPQPLLVDLHGDQSHLESYLNRNGTTWAKPTQIKSPSVPNGGKATGLHIVAPLGSTLYIIEAGSGCIQSIEIGDTISAMVQADDVHGTNSLDLVVSTASGSIITLESSSPFHPLNTWNHGETRGSKNSLAHGYSASQGIFVHEASRQFRDIFGVYVPVTFQIFDNRPGIASEPAKRVYQVEVRDGTSSQRPIIRKNYNATGVYTERVYIPYGPGFYTLTVVLKTSHGLIYEDSFHLGYNVHYMDGFGILLWLPLVAAAICIVVCGRKKPHWDDDEFGANERSGQNLGILGRATLPTSV